MVFLVIGAIILGMIFFPIFRCAVFHPVSVVIYTVKDLVLYIVRKKGDVCGACGAVIRVSLNHAYRPDIRSKERVQLIAHGNHVTDLLGQVQRDSDAGTGLDALKHIGRNAAILGSLLTTKVIVIVLSAIKGRENKDIAVRLLLSGLVGKLTVVESNKDDFFHRDLPPNPPLCG